MPSPATPAPRPALLLIDLQLAIDHPSWGRRNQPKAEDQVARLLAAWRTRGLPVLHVRHHSRAQESTYRPGQAGAAFKPGLGPRPGEPVFTKSAHAAFVGTGLNAWLKLHELTALVIAGVITDNSVEATARLASDLGYATTVVADACFTFGRCDRQGEYRDARLLHELSLARLQGEYTAVRDTDAVLAALDECGPNSSEQPASLRDKLGELPRSRRWREQGQPAAVVGVLLQREDLGRGQTLLLKRRRPPYAGLWSLPGGKWEFGETLAAAALREAHEETGLRAEFLGLAALLDECLCPIEAGAEGAHFLLHLCRLRAMPGETAASPEGEVRWFSEDELVSLGEQMVPSDFRLLGELAQLVDLGHFEAEVEVDAAGVTRLRHFARRA